MFGLTPTVTAVILTIILAVVSLAYLLIGWLRKRSWRVMLRGIGFVLMPVGLLIMGLMTQIVIGLQAIVDWANATYMTGWIMFGLILGGLGLIVYLVGSFVPHVAGEEATARREAMKARRIAALQTNRPAPTPQATPPAAAPKAPVTTPGTTPALPATTSPTTTPVAPVPQTDEDKEVDDILRRHGIT